MYMIDLDDSGHENLCLTANKDNLAWLWHRRLGHASYNVVHKLVKYKMVKRLPKISFNKKKYFVNHALRKNKLENHLKSEQKTYLQSL